MPTSSDKATPRQFDTGATRDTDVGKFDYEGFLSPLVLQRFAEYMHGHRTLADGSMRDSDNWQKGIPQDVYMKSLHRHFMDVWLHHRGLTPKEPVEEALCAILFNVQGYLLETLKKKAECLAFSEEVTTRYREATALAVFPAGADPRQMWEPLRAARKAE